MKNILFVCTQNVFRSYSCQVLLEKYLVDNNILSLKVDSCGTIAYDWERPYSYTIDRLKFYGVDVLNHKNKQISQELVNWADLVVCMTFSHLNYVEENFANSNCVLFNEVAIGKKLDLSDDNETNFDCSLEDFVFQTVDYIEKNIENFYLNLKKFN